MSEPAAETPPPALTDIVGSLSERATALHANLLSRQEAGAEPVPPSERKPGQAAASAGAALSFVAQADRRNVTALIDALDTTPPEEVPETPDGLTGSPLSQWVTTEKALADLDAERFADSGRLPPSLKARYAAWDGLRQQLEPAVRQHLTDLDTALGRQEHTIRNRTPEPSEEAPQPRRSAWR